MDIRSYTTDSYHLYQVFGTLEMSVIENISDNFEEAIVSHREKVVFDFRETLAVDAAAVRYLERFTQALSAIGKRLYFVSVKGQPAQMLDLLCLLRNIEIFPSIEVFNSAGSDKIRKHHAPPQPADSDASRSFIMMVSLLSVLRRAQMAPEC
jgi:anti-anti-sigma regulatory factor